MERIGYYARLKGTKDLFQFEWKPNDEFYIQSNGTWVKREPKEFDVIEVGYFTNGEQQVKRDENQYSVFLLAMLGREIGYFDKDLEYDTHWSEASNLYYNEFRNSKFDDDEQPEYECIVNFFKSKLK